MNTDRLEGKWKQAMGQLREKWGKLTEDDLEMIAGRRDQLIGRLQERYGIAKEEAEKRANEFIDSLADEPAPKKRAARQR
ncbi:MAG: PqqD family peptide modification chaperone [Candidatus Acidiferrum sp.]